MDNATIQASGSMRLAVSPYQSAILCFQVVNPILVNMICEDHHQDPDTTRALRCLFLSEVAPFANLVIYL